MSFLTVQLNPAYTTSQTAETVLYTVNAVRPVAQRNGSPRKRDQERAAGGSGQREPDQTVPEQTTRGTLRDILV